MKRGVLVLLGIILCLKLVSAGLGITPAIVEYNFEPGLEKTISIRVMESDPNMELKLYVEGDLSEYFELDRETLVGSGYYNVKMKLPEHINQPGLHIIYLGSKEMGVAGGGITSAIDARVVVKIHVPYPGKYAEITEFSVGNVNRGDNAKFQIKVASRGGEDIDANTHIALISDEEIIDTLSFEPITILSGQMAVLDKVVNTSVYGQGDYIARAIVEYVGGKAEAETKFRVGSLLVNIIDFTRTFKLDTINRFDIDINSLWNNKLDNVFATVEILKNNQVKANFKTPSVELAAWKNETLRGYFETDGFAAGKYKAKVYLDYGGQTKKEGDIIIKGFSWVYISITFIIAGLVLLGYVYFKKRKNKKS